MQFRLVYRGPLPSESSGGRIEEKHEVRRQFHPQLRELWNLVPVLLEWQEYDFVTENIARPKENSQIRNLTPQADENPFFCLLEDDRFISDIGVTTDRLLLPMTDICGCCVLPSGLNLSGCIPCGCIFNKKAPLMTVEKNAA